MALTPKEALETSAKRLSQLTDELEHKIDEALSKFDRPNRVVTAWIGHSDDVPDSVRKSLTQRFHRAGWQIEVEIVDGGQVTMKFGARNLTELI